MKPHVRRKSAFFLSNTLSASSAASSAAPSASSSSSAAIAAATASGADTSSSSAASGEKRRRHASQRRAKSGRQRASRAKAVGSASASRRGEASSTLRLRRDRRGGNSRSAAHPLGRRRPWMSAASIWARRGGTIGRGRGQCRATPCRRAFALRHAPRKCLHLHRTCLRRWKRQRLLLRRWRGARRGEARRSTRRRQHASCVGRHRYRLRRGRTGHPPWGTERRGGRSRAARGARRPVHPRGGRSACPTRW